MVKSRVGNKNKNKNKNKGQQGFNPFQQQGMPQQQQGRQQQQKGMPQQPQKGFNPFQQQGMPKLSQEQMMKMFQKQYQKNNKKNNSFDYYVRNKKTYKASEKTSKGSTIKKHLKHLSERVKKSYKLVSGYREDYAQKTRTKLETANQALKEVYMYLKNKDKKEKKRRGKRTRKNNSNNSSSSSD